MPKRILRSLTIVAALGIAVSSFSAAEIQIVMRQIVMRLFSHRVLLALVMAAFTVAGLTLSACGSNAATQPTGSHLFDSSVVHAVDVSFAEEDYDAMIEAYKSSDVKEWIEATVTIDGTTYQNVGMRLKGNSSIRGLKDGRTRGPGGNTSAAAPDGLPWLIRLDKNVDGQNHNGVSDFVVRSNNSESALNEAVSLRLLEQAGLASQDAVYVRFSVNGGNAVLRLVIENPDDIWMAKEFDAGGALYKAESTGDYTYRGADPDSYDEVFDQEAGKNNADLTPLLEFLEFINKADDATFIAELPDRLDIDAFATYLAMQELIANSDDIDGPGNNSYLYYDHATGRFTVAPWDHNLAFGGMGAAGFPGNGDGGMAPGMDTGESDGRLPERMQPPMDGESRPAAGRGPGGKSNILVERFTANPKWKQLYQERLADLRGELYESGRAADVLDGWVTLLKTQASDLVDSTIVDTEAAKISAYFSTP